MINPFKYYVVAEGKQSWKNTEGNPNPSDVIHIRLLQNYFGKRKVDVFLSFPKTNKHAKLIVINELQEWLRFGKDIPSVLEVMGGKIMIEPPTNKDINPSIKKTTINDGTNIIYTDFGNKKE